MGQIQGGIGRSTTGKGTLDPDYRRLPDKQLVTAAIKRVVGKMELPSHEDLLLLSKRIKDIEDGIRSIPASQVYDDAIGKAQDAINSIVIETKDDVDKLDIEAILQALEQLDEAVEKAEQAAALVGEVDYLLWDEKPVSVLFSGFTGSVRAKIYPLTTTQNIIYRASGSVDVNPITGELTATGSGTGTVWAIPTSATGKAITATFAVGAPSPLLMGDTPLAIGDDGLFLWLS